MVLNYFGIFLLTGFPLYKICWHIYIKFRKEGNYERLVEYLKSQLKYEKITREVPTIFNFKIGLSTFEDVRRKYPLQPNNTPFEAESIVREFLLPISPKGAVFFKFDYNNFLQKVRILVNVPPKLAPEILGSFFFLYKLVSQKHIDGIYSFEFEKENLNITLGYNTTKDIILVSYGVNS